MKTKLLLLLLILTTSYLNAQVVNIPDPNFLIRLINHTAWGGVHIDTNNNYQIEVSEAEAVTADIIVYSPWNSENMIVDMTGIEAFINITGLDCSYNQIESLDLNQNTLLEYLDCSTNNIHSLNVSQCTALVELDCSENDLTSIDVSNSHSLVDLICNTNNITTLTTSEFNTELTDIWCGGNEINSLDLSFLISLERLGCTYNNLSSLDLYNNINLSFLSCAYNQITYLDISQNLLLNILAFKNNMITSIDVSHCTLLESIRGSENQLMEIDLSLNSKLKIVELENNQLIAMNIRNTNNTIITDFDVTNNPSLICIFVDEAIYSKENWTNVDITSHFVNNQEECDAIGLDDLDVQQTFTIYPNPSTDIFTIKTDIPFYSIKIYNAMGKLITNLPKQDTYNVSTINSGVYTLQILTKNNTITKKIIIK